MAAVEGVQAERGGVGPRLHVVAAAFTAADRPGGSGAVYDHSLLRAARQVVDPLPRSERDDIGAVILATAADEAQAVAALARRQTTVLSLRNAVAIPLHGLGAQALFTALHIGRGLLSEGAAGYVLVASQEAHGGGAGVFLLARGGGAPCLPLPPVCDAAGSGAALAAALERSGIGVRSIGAVAAPRRDAVEAAAAARAAGRSQALKGAARLQVAPSVEAALASGVAEPSPLRTLLWGSDAAGRLGACVLEPEAG